MLAVRLGFRAPFAAVLMGFALAANGCAPASTNSTYGSADLGRTASLSRGTIVSMRGATVQNQNAGVGAPGGAAVGGRDVRGTILGAVSGAVVGGVGGYAAEGAVEFIIQEDNAPAPISVVQSNEGGFRPGERVVLTRGSRTRIARAGV